MIYGMNKISNKRLNKKNCIEALYYLNNNISIGNKKLIKF